MSTSALPAAASTSSRRRSPPRRHRTFLVIATTLVCLAAGPLFATASSEQADSEVHPLYDLVRRSDSSVNSSLVETARMSLLAGQRASWEQGTAQTALTELDAGQWSVFAGRNHGPPYRPYHLRPQASGFPMSVMGMAYHSVRAQDRLGKLASSVSGDEDAEGGSAADPASCGESVLMAAFRAGQINSTSGYWISSATRQLDYLLNDAPRSTDGAISHRANAVQFWSDAIYMMPPFLAAYGLYTSNQTLLQEAYDQIRIYRDHMRIQSGPAQNLWGHILSYGRNGTHAPSWTDRGAWATGEGWVTGGMLRVLASIAQSPFSDQMQSEKTDLVNWTNEILEAAYPLVDPTTNLFHNYLNDSTSFTDAAGSAMIAYSTFRLASMGTGHTDHVDAAEAIYNRLQNKVTVYGSIRAPLVNVLSFHSAGGTSPEALSFLLLLEAARRDYRTGNVTGIDGPGLQLDANGGAMGVVPYTAVTMAAICLVVSVLVAVVGNGY